MPIFMYQFKYTPPAWAGFPGFIVSSRNQRTEALSLTNC